MTPLLAAVLPDLINQNLGWLLFGLIVLIGVAIGAQDLLRLSSRRIRAIAGVSFWESIRRRVLWITPLAILGIVIVSQLQRPLDELDAIRQTTKICLFATGLVVAVTTVILACTNLPREIENRVIYTVVTKPTTRLEIVLGKVLGFAMVSLTILLIMGVFSFGYLWLRATAMHRELARKLETPGLVPVSSRATVEYYRDAGLLGAKKQENASELQVFSRLPYETGSRRYMAGSGEGQFLAAFDINPEELRPSPSQEPGQRGLIVFANVGYVRKNATTEPSTVPTTRTASTGPTTVPYWGPFIVSPEQRQKMMAGVKPIEQPKVSMDVMDENQNSIGQIIPFPPATVFELGSPNKVTELHGLLEPKFAHELRGRCYVRVVGLDQNTEYFVDLAQTPSPVQLKAPKTDDDPESKVRDLADVPPAPDPADPSKILPPIFQSRSGTYGMQLRGGPTGMPTAVYRFRNTDVSPENGETPFELKSGIERSGADELETPAAAEPTRVGVRIRNRTSGAISDEVTVQPESNRTIFFRVPAANLAGGNFDVLLRCLTPGDFVGLLPKSLVLVTARQPFAWNLFKSMLILWLMAILVTTVAIFSSTFLSWPIAVVLTLVILLGHWGVDQLSDSLQPGLGNTFVNDMGIRNPAKAEAVRATVEKLSTFLNLISTVLPDINKFPAVEDIERGIAIPAAKLRDAAGVAFGFGLPLVLLSYVFLRNKEVAP